MTNRVSKIFSATLVILIISCNSDLPLKSPIFSKDFNQTMQEIGATGSFSDVSFKVATNQHNNEKLVYELELKLLNGKNIPSNDKGLDSLARVAATILKSSVQNINDYDEISVIFDYDDGTPFDITRKNVFVYYPTELK